MACVYPLMRKIAECPYILGFQIATAHPGNIQRRILSIWGRRMLLAIPQAKSGTRLPIHRYSTFMSFGVRKLTHSPLPPFHFAIFARTMTQIAERLAASEDA